MWGDLAVTYGDKKSAFDIRSTHPDHRHLEKTIMISGRFLNDLDLEEKRKVAVIGIAVRDFLFESVDPLGKYIEIGGISYRVVGVYQDKGGEGELRKIYVPITTAQMAYNAGDRIHALMFTMGDIDATQSKEVERRVHEMMSARHNYAPNDERALRIRNNLEQYQKIMSIFDAIQIFVWIVGAGTIVAGIVGVSNIMLISVKERTKEFGVRKSLGATPWSITSMVVQESIVLTAISGYFGLVAGIALLEVAGKFVEFVKDAQVDLGLAMTATGLLVFCGALAGYFPARRAASVNPVVALRDE
jgi:putative ABC transport system permease protein